MEDQIIICKHLCIYYSSAIWSVISQILHFTVAHMKCVKDTLKSLVY